MDKKIAGKYAGLAGAVALIITIICQITHNGAMPWKVELAQNVGNIFVILVKVKWIFGMIVIINFGEELRNLVNVLKDEQKISKIT